jgi:transcriptional regulator with XRE-family HTH domain
VKKERKKSSGKFAKRTIELRKYMGWTQTELSVAAECPRESLSKIERRITDPQYSAVESIIEKGFGITEKDFFDLEKIPESLKKRKEYEMKKKNKLK